MAFKTVNFAAAGGAYNCSENDDQSGAYVKAAEAESVREALSKLIWAVHYSNGHEASAAATRAEQLMHQLGC